MKARYLEMSLGEAIEAFETKKWKFFSVDEEKKTVTLESRIAAGESYMVELKFASPQELEDLQVKLRAANFVKQNVKYVGDY